MLMDGDNVDAFFVHALENGLKLALCHDEVAIYDRL
jgi:hypothetical protein